MSYLMSTVDKIRTWALVDDVGIKRKQHILTIFTEFAEETLGLTELRITELR